MRAYRIHPQDLLFFRDARPMEANVGSGGHGARWPAPSLIFDAIHAALHRAFPGDQQQPWEHTHRPGVSSDRDMTRKREHRFGSLTTAGPFPRLEDGTWLFPAPADFQLADAGDHFDPASLRGGPLLPMTAETGEHNLPRPLRYPLGATVRAGKQVVPEWWSARAYGAWLRGEPVPAVECRRGSELFDAEWNTGIAIDPDTGTTGSGEVKGKIYSAEYLRLRDHVALGVLAAMPLKNNGADGLDHLFAQGHIVILGGQQRACQVFSEEVDAPILPAGAPPLGERLKWTLLSPAVFPAIEGCDGQAGKPFASAHPGGWLPNWVAPVDDYEINNGGERIRVGQGQVLLKEHEPRQGRGRAEWREAVRQKPFLDCRLVAARIPKAVVLTGWSEHQHHPDEKAGPRPTLLAVPAGAIYYFEGPDAAKLADVLNWHGPADPGTGKVINRRSTRMGEKGFGLGVCGPWTAFEEHRERKPELQTQGN